MVRGLREIVLNGIVALAAERLVFLLFAQHDLLFAGHDTVAHVGKGSATDTDGMHLGHFIGNGAELGHGAEGVRLEVEVQPGHNHTYPA